MWNAKLIDVGGLNFRAREVESAFPCSFFAVFEAYGVMVFGMYLPFGRYSISVTMQSIDIFSIILKVRG